MNVKRYTHDRSSYRPSFMDEQSDGDYVLHSDYAALLARHAALKEAVKKYFKSECLEILKHEARAEVDRLLQEEK